jgi:hypothetical protein
MSDFLTVAELVDRIKEQNGTEMNPAYMDWMLRNGCFYREVVSVEDIPRIMNELQQAGLIPNTDMKPVQPQVSERKSQGNVEPAAVECESQDNVVKESRSRTAVIADYVGAAIDDLMGDSLHWKMAPGDTDAMWFEVWGAIMAKMFDFQHEMGRQELYSEQVVENCL